MLSQSDASSDAIYIEEVAKIPNTKWEAESCVGLILRECWYSLPNFEVSKVFVQEGIDKMLIFG